MRIVTTVDCPPGALLARPLVDVTGRILLPAGSSITEATFAALQRKEVTTLIIDDDELTDVNVPELAPSDLHAHVTAALFRTVQDLATLVRAFRFDGLRAIQISVRTTKFARNVLRSEGVRSLEPALGQLLDEMNTRVPIDGAASLIIPASSVQRAVDSALLAATLARRLGLELDRQRQIALGMLLRDLGMMFVEPEILDATNELPIAAWKRIRQHPALGYLLARVIAPNDVFAQIVCLQHHEHQNGQGYPRGLAGSNKLQRKRNYRNANDVVVPEAEIAALIDVFMAVTAHRPYRAAVSTDAGMREVVSMAGTVLNKELVRLFIQSFVWYPVRSRVRVRGGAHSGHTGVVIGCNAEQPARPRIRLLEDSEGRSIAPIDLDLSETSDAIDGLPVPPTGDPAAGKWALADEVERIVASHAVAGPVEFAADPAPA